MVEVELFGNQNRLKIGSFQTDLFSFSKAYDFCLVDGVEQLGIHKTIIAITVKPP